MNILVFDTETVGVITQDLLNVGYKIIDLNPATSESTTLVKRDYLVADLYNNTPLMINDMFVGAEKYGIYTALLERKQIIKHSIEKIFDIMRNDLARYKPLFAFAYNCDFDTDKFGSTSGITGFTVQRMKHTAFGKDQSISDSFRLKRRTLQGRAIRITGSMIDRAAEIRGETICPVRTFRTAHDQSI